MTSSRALAPFGTSVFTTFSRLAREAGAIDLGQGFPDFDGPGWIKEAAHAAMRAGRNQYAQSIGAARLRRAIAADVHARLGIAYDPESEITVTTGATEGIAAAMLGLLDPGDEVLTFEPFYDSYPACAAMAGARLRAVPLHPPGFVFDASELERAFGSGRVRMFLLNTPHNPTGRVFSQAEIERIAALCHRHDALLVTDEVYEHLVFGGKRHLTPAAVERKRTVRLSSAAKTFSLTGWKVGWACAGPDLTDGLRRAHQFLVFCTAPPLQEAIARALEQAPDRGYYEELRREYAARREVLLSGLCSAKYRVAPPEGTYFAMAAPPEREESEAFVRRLIRERGVGAIPPGSFYLHPEHGATWVRFAFCKRLETLRAAMARIIG